ncbi:MAG: bifunctional folylpolyglutamate synthase/dihydrofolate synthase [Candidatus Hydrogenedentes bacterium]|nr:bifunctional folylpolyglutamate synthase/dihydrofolate synthase [Candidatus Hydrogenedentota bacterium]
MTPSALTRPDSAARQYLFDLTLHGIKLGLENIQALVCAAGDPHRAVPVIHVGGTNGKGSVCAMISAMLRSAGYRAGRFTSPHLIDVSERFLIDGEPIPEAALEENIAFFRDVSAAMDRVPTFFEMTTAIGFRYFAQEKVDVAIIEVGMGGRFDSTNVVAPVATAITNIDLEHTAFLGDTLAKIAFEKAGIIKPGIPVVTAERRPEAFDVFTRRAEEEGAPLLQLGRDFRAETSGSPWAQRLRFSSSALRLEDVSLALPGRYQGENAAVAAALASQLMDAFPKLNASHIATGLASASWPCRVEKVLDTPPVFIDVAHNGAGARKLADLFEDCVLVFAASSDKDRDAMLDALRPRARQIVLTQFEGKRATPVEELAALLPEGTFETRPDLPAAIARGLELATPACPLLITGSIYAAGEAREYLIREHGVRPLRF